MKSGRAWPASSRRLPGFLRAVTLRVITNAVRAAHCVHCAGRGNICGAVPATCAALVVGNGANNERQCDMTEATTPKKATRHRATYSTDKRNGGYLIRVSGPTPELFVGREVPVTMKSGEVHFERLVRLVWSGSDQQTGEKVAIYKFESRPRATEEAEF